jgi:MYXO-CTERM domain-containing protein
MRPPKLLAVLFAVITGVVLFAFARPAFAAGAFKLKSNDVNEVSGAWHLYVTIELPKPPLTAHQPMKFVFTKTAVYERSLVDGRNDPVQNIQTVNDPTPAVENLDVDFADPSGKIFKGTRFDFGLTRTRGFEAGEYTVELRTSDGTNIGGKQNLKLRGDNPVVDRRAIAFNPKDKSIKKIDAVDAGGNQAKNDEPAAATNMSGDVTPTGTATGFVPQEGMQETDEEKIKTRPKGCGCEVPGGFDATAYLFLLPLAGLGAIAMRRRRSGAAAS